MAAGVVGTGQARTAPRPQPLYIRTRRCTCHEFHSWWNAAGEGPLWSVSSARNSPSLVKPTARRCTLQRIDSV